MVTKLDRSDSPPSIPHTQWYGTAMEKLVPVVQKLSQTRNLDAVIAIVRQAARDLTGADGATFVLRDNGKCYYAEENAISPLWKGQRFPLGSCISGWVMLNRRPAVIEDIYEDPRIPADAYRPTFVKSLAMVPIRTEDPVGAIGNYWAVNRLPTDEEVSVLQTLANFTSVAMENVELYAHLEEKIEALQKSNAELSTFAWAASHDLKTPLRAIHSLAEWIEEDCANGEPGKATEHLRALRQRVQRMNALLDSILDYAQVESRSTQIEDEFADGKTLKDDILALVDLPPGFELTFAGAFDQVSVPRLAAQRIFGNLIGNAVKHHDRDSGTIEVDACRDGPNYRFSVRDDGPGIPAEYHAKIFEMFQTLKTRDTTGGSGMGLALVKKVVAAFGGAITVEPAPVRGAVFQFTLPAKMDRQKRPD